MTKVPDRRKPRGRSSVAAYRVDWRTVTSLHVTLVAVHHRHNPPTLPTVRIFYTGYAKKAQVQGMAQGGQCRKLLRACRNSQTRHGLQFACFRSNPAVFAAVLSGFTQVVPHTDTTKFPEKLKASNPLIRQSSTKYRIQPPLFGTTHTTTQTHTAFTLS